MAFIAVVTAIIAGGYTYLASQLLLPLELRGPLAWLIWLIFAVPFVQILWLPLIYWQKDETSEAEDRFLKFIFTGMGFLSFLLFYCVGRDLLSLAMRVGGFVAGFLRAPGIVGGFTEAVTGWLAGPDHLPLAFFDARGSIAILFLALVSLLIGYRETQVSPTVRRVSVPIDGLPDGLRGLTIAQISDLHVGPAIRAPFVDEVVRTINGLKPDLVAMTGDIVDGSIARFAPVFDRLKEIHAPLGRFYVPGNHESYWEYEAWLAHIRSAGMRMLLNSHEVVERGGAKLVIAGALDYWSKRNGLPEATDPAKALDGAPADAGARILLAHQPSTAIQASTLGYDLQLSGHTHGGQFIPWTLVIHWLQPFVRGLGRMGRMWVYVNRGTGYWGPPVRLGSPSEITLLTLECAPRAEAAPA